jgi:hypothetical protein
MRPHHCYKEPLTDSASLCGDASFGYGNRACPDVALTKTELLTLIGALLWSFTVKRRESAGCNDSLIPWYETNPYVITVSKLSSCRNTMRSEEKRNYIMNEYLDLGYVVKKDQGERQTQWNIVRPEDVGALETLRTGKPYNRRNTKRGRA